MRFGGWIVLSSVALGVCAPACMYPDFGFRDESGSGGTTATGTPTAGGFGGSTTTGTPTATGGAGTGVGTGTGTGTGGTGGSGGADCELLGPHVCGAQKCSVVDPNTGATGCVDAGTRPSWAYCTADTDCPNRTWCDLEAEVCKPLCQDGGGQCVAGAECRPARQSGGGAIPGLDVCTSHCDPRDVHSCNQAHGNVNCVYAPYGFDCMSTGDTIAYLGCDDSRDCEPGLGCYVYGLKLCRPWCDSTSTFCPNECFAHSPQVFYDGVHVGSCNL